MILTYDIINKNLAKLDDAIRIFPKILGKYQTSSDAEDRARIKLLSDKVGLSAYIELMDYINAKGQLVYKEISFVDIKEAMIDSCADKKVKDFMLKKTKKGLHSFICSKQFGIYGGYDQFGRSKRPKYFNYNFNKCSTLLINYIIQNKINFTSPSSSITKFYVDEISNFEIEVNTELDITKDIVQSISRKISTIKYDFRKINFHLLKCEIENKIKERILNVEDDEKIKCIEAQTGLTYNKTYNVINYEIGSKGNLLVKIKNDNNLLVNYNYRIFESISRSRENNINDILNQL